MAKLSDLVNVNINRDTIKIQGAEIPVLFTMKSFPYVEEAYGKTYKEFESDMNEMLKDGQVTLGKNEIHLMNSLIYAMVRSGGTDCTLSEIEEAIPISDLPSIFNTAFYVFSDQSLEDQK